MISSKKILFSIISIAVCFYLPVFATEPNRPNKSNEPNKPAAELKFEMSSSPVRWLSYRNEPGRGPVKPEYMAELYIRRTNNIPGQAQSGIFDILLQTDIGKSMSPGQKEFLQTSSSYESLDAPFPDKPIGYVRIHLYAVSREDAEKMARAFIEQVNDTAQARIKQFKEEIRKMEEAFSQAKKDLPEKESQLKETAEAYRKIKEDTHQFSSDEEAVALAKKTIVEMDKTFNDLDIELAGLQERLKTIEIYRNKSGQLPEIKVKLDSMYIDLMIELSGLEARRKVAREIYARQQEFLRLFNRRMELQKEVDELKRSINTQGNIEKATRDLNQRKQDFFPAEIYKNTVTIYPVKND